MKLTATVMGERRLSDLPVSMDFTRKEPYAVADVLVDGDAALIAASLRALADAIDPYSPLAGIYGMVKQSVPDTG